MIVRRGIFPPVLASSLASCCISRGSNAILLPPSNAEPAWAWCAASSGGGELLLLPPPALDAWSLSSSSSLYDDVVPPPPPPTRRLERPPEVDIGILWLRRGRRSNVEVPVTTGFLGGELSSFKLTPFSNNKCKLLLWDEKKLFSENSVDFTSLHLFRCNMAAVRATKREPTNWSNPRTRSLNGKLLNSITTSWPHPHFWTFENLQNGREEQNHQLTAWFFQKYLLFDSIILQIIYQIIEKKSVPKRHLKNTLLTNLRRQSWKPIWLHSIFVLIILLPSEFLDYQPLSYLNLDF